MFRRTATIAAVLATLTAVAWQAPAAGATKPCPIDFCTDAGGEYVLGIPPLSANPGLGAYSDCVWDVHVDFGDGTDQDYVFDAAVGLTGSHVFPAPGTYTVTVVLSGGHHGDSAEPCPGFQLQPEVLYRTPAEEADDPAGEGEGGEPPPTNPPGGGEGGQVPAPIPVAPDQVALDAWGPGAPPPESTAYWTRCRGEVLTHLVACARGRRLARIAGGRLTRPGSTRVAGFACRFVRGASPPIACAHGEQRLLAPSLR